jgi:AcrR family transcriptional regulator
VSKGEETRQAILAKAFELATVVGLAGLSIGRLAEETRLSKSGLFAHFGSKEALEVAVVEEASRQFVQEVMLPALREPRGEPRLRALFAHWLKWGDRMGGCFFVGASAELDDRPCPARDALVRVQKDWVDELAKATRIAVSEGHFHAKVDPDQFAFELYSIMLGAHLFARFLHEPATRKRTEEAFERLVSAARTPEHASRRSSQTNLTSPSPSSRTRYFRRSRV